MPRSNKINHEYLHLVRRFANEYPYLKYSFDEKEIVDKIKETDACQVSGRVFNTLEITRYNIIPLDPFNISVPVTINRIAIVCRAARKNYHEIIEYIQNNPELENIEELKKGFHRFHLVKNMIEESLSYGFTRSYFFEVDSPALLFSKFNEKTKSDIIKEKIKESLASGLVINNLKEKKKPVPVKHKLDSLFCEEAIHSKIETYKLRSKKKGLTSDVTFENSRQLFQRKYCQLTGMELNVYKNTEFAHPDSFSIDRINRFEGYNITNMIVLCHDANQVKGALEKFNYSEDIDKIKDVLKETRARIINKYKGNSQYKFKDKKARPIDLILKDYAEARKNRTNLQFII